MWIVDEAGPKRLKMSVLVEEDSARFFKRDADIWSNRRAGLFLRVDRNKNEDVSFHSLGQMERD